MLHDCPDAVLLVQAKQKNAGLKSLQGRTSTAFRLVDCLCWALWNGSCVQNHRYKACKLHELGVMNGTVS